MDSKRAVVVAGLAGAFVLFSLPLKADGPPDPDFNLETFHRHAQVGKLRQTIERAPTCVKGKGVQGLFVMTTPEQDNFPFSVTTTVGPSGAQSFVTSTSPDNTSSTALSDVAGVLNEEAKDLVKKIIADCKAPQA
jgi:hypothetical protein